MLTGSEHVNEYGYRMHYTRTDTPRELRFDTKWQRMKHLENLLKQHPWTKSGLARQLHVHRSTIGRYIDEMSELVLIQEDDNGRLSIAN